MKSCPQDQDMGSQTTYVLKIRTGQEFSQVKPVPDSLGTGETGIVPDLSPPPPSRGRDRTAPPGQADPGHSKSWAVRKAREYWQPRPPGTPHGWWLVADMPHHATCERCTPRHRPASTTE